MLKQLKITALGTILALAGFVTSCSKQHEPSALPTVHNLNQEANEDLVATMAADQLVKEYVLADVEYTKKYATWYWSLSAAEKQARDNAVEGAIAAGNTPSDPVNSQQENASYQETQQARDAAIKTKYPQLASLNEEAFADVQTRVFKAFTAGMPDFAVRSSGCVAGYYACNAACSRCNGCTRGYYACIQASPPGSW